jgi:hypothetical protein
MFVGLWVCVCVTIHAFCLSMAPTGFIGERRVHVELHDYVVNINIPGRQPITEAKSFQEPGLGVPAGFLAQCAVVASLKAAH